MGLTYAESLALRLPGMTEEERTVLLWKAPVAAIRKVAESYGIDSHGEKASLIPRVAATAAHQARIGVQMAFV